jgi:GTPase SAR1 family protein
MELSRDIWMLILKELSLPDLGVVCRVSKTLKSYAESDLLWKRFLEEDDFFDRPIFWLPQYPDDAGALSLKEQVHRGRHIKLESPVLNLQAKFRVVVIGSGSQGKTTLIHKIATGKLYGDSIPTVCDEETCEYKETEFVFRDTFNFTGENARLLGLNFDDSVDAFFFCFSATNSNLKQMTGSYDYLKDELAPYLPQAQLICVITKCDLKPVENAKYLTNQKIQWAKETGFNAFCETSSVDDRWGTHQLMDLTLELLRKRQKEKPPLQAERHRKKDCLLQ